METQRYKGCESKKQKRTARVTGCVRKLRGLKVRSGSHAESYTYTSLI